MIDSMAIIDFNRYCQNKKRSLDTRKKKSDDGKPKAVINPYIRWLVTMGRDNKLITWKLFDGKVMYTDEGLPLFNSMKTSDQESSSLTTSRVTSRSQNKSETEED